MAAKDGKEEDVDALVDRLKSRQSATVSKNNSSNRV